MVVLAKRACDGVTENCCEHSFKHCSIGIGNLCLFSQFDKDFSVMTAVIYFDTHSRSAYGQCFYTTYILHYS